MPISSTRMYAQAKLRQLGMYKVQARCLQISLILLGTSCSVPVTLSAGTSGMGTI